VVAFLDGTVKPPGAQRADTPLRVRPRLRTQLIVAFSALVAVAVTFTSWVALTRVERASSRGFERRVDTLLKGVDRRLSTLGQETSTRMESLKSALLEPPLAGPLLVRPDPGDSAVIEAAGRMRSQSGLDLLQILDADGVILSSAQWPERVGFQSRELLGLPEGQPEFRYERTPQEEILAQVVHRTAELGDRRVHLVGGKILNHAFLRQVSPAQGEMVLLLDVRLEARAVVGGVSMAEVVSARFAQELSAAMASGREARGRMQLDDGSVWTAGSSPLRSPSGELLGTLVVAADREELEDLIARLRNRFLFIGAIGVLLAAAAGLWVAHRITKPVEELVRAVDDLSAGREHLPLPTGDDGEIGRLMTAFSRMDRSLREQQRRLLASERVAAWKEVAQRVAHEVKNPLSPIRLTMENLIKARREKPELFDELFDDGSRAILEEVSQLGSIVTEFTQFARLPAPRPEWIDLDAVVDSVIALYSKHEGLTVKRVQQEPLEEVFLDPELISRAVANLVKNAVEAMEPQGGGELQVTTGMEGENAYIELCDSGPGFPEDTKGTVFKPYFTTKEKGTGLGMAIALRIISEHRGSLSAENRREGGARVLVTLPPAGATDPELTESVDRKDQESREEADS
jgi:signal transduction histidine kinase